MKIKIVSRNISVTKGMREEANERLSAIEKFLEHDQQVKVSVISIKGNIIISTMFLYNGKLVKVEKNGDDYYALLNEVADSLKEKLQRLHTKKIKMLQDQEHALSTMDYDHEADEKDAMGLIVKHKQIKIVEMSAEEAIEKMEDLGHESFIFKNKETGNVCMIYTRNDGKYGIIETE